MSKTAVAAGQRVSISKHSDLCDPTFLDLGYAHSSFTVAACTRQGKKISWQKKKQ
jgi:hypothetical protein